MYVCGWMGMPNCVAATMRKQINTAPAPLQRFLTLSFERTIKVSATKTNQYFDGKRQNIKKTKKNYQEKSKRYGYQNTMEYIYTAIYDAYECVCETGESFATNGDGKKFIQLN